jgi:hypothetical protein
MTEADKPNTILSLSDEVAFIAYCSQRSDGVVL